MTFIIFCIIILLGIGAWFFLVQKDGLGMNGGSIRDFILQKPENKREETAKEIAAFYPTTETAAVEYRIATTIPDQLPSVFSGHEQSKEEKTNTVVLKPDKEQPSIPVKLEEEKQPL